GGEIRVSSQQGLGSTFTLYLPQSYVVPRRRADRGQNPAAEARDGRDQHQEERPSFMAPDTRRQYEEREDRQDTHHSSSSYGATATDTAEEPMVVIEEQIPDDRDSIQQGDRSVLIIEDDPNFARILLEMARQKGFKALVATRGETGLNLAKRYRPDAITLDIELPDMEGWTILDRLKHEKATRHIPVHII